MISKRKTKLYSGHSEPKTILFLDHSAQWSGGEISLFSLVTHLNRDRWNPVVVLFEDGPLREKLSMAGIETRLLPLDKCISKVQKDNLGLVSLLRFEEMGRMWRFCVRLRRLIWSENAAVVHCNSLKADILGGLAGRMARVPVIWHVRDRIAPDYLPAVVVRGFRLLAHLLPNYVIAVSSAVFDTLRLPGRTSRVIHNGSVVHDGIKPTYNSSVPHQNVVGLVGRISPWKGQHIFVEAAAKVRTSFPEVTYQVIGSALFGEDGYEAKTRARATELGLDDVLEWTGFRQDVSELVSEMTVVVHASTTGEPFGQVIVEGMLAAKPVVATNGGGVPEIVQNGQTGILVPMNDAPAMAEAIIYLLKHPEEAEAMGQKGRKVARERFTIQATVSKVEAIYEQLLIL